MLAQQENYVPDFAQMNANLSRETFAANGGSTGQIEMSSVCRFVNAASALQAATLVDNPAFVPVLPSRYSGIIDEIIAPMTSALVTADQNIAIGQPTGGVFEPFNIVCSTIDTGNNVFIGALWVQAITFDNPIQNDWVRVVIEDVYPG